MVARAIVVATAFLCVAATPLTEETLSVHNGTLRLALVGDAGLQTVSVASAITKTKPYDAILLLGDNFYPCGVRSATDPKWHVVDALTHLDIPIYAVLGNHDYCGKPDVQVDRSSRDFRGARRS